MRENEQVSRYEVNRSVRMVFTRHNVDLTKIDYSFMGSVVYLSGDLVRPDGDFSRQEIESIVREIANLPHVRDIQFELNTWRVAAAGDSWHVDRIKKEVSRKKAASGSGLADDSTHIIEKTEDLEVVLDDIAAHEKRKG